MSDRLQAKNKLLLVTNSELKIRIDSLRTEIKAKVDEIYRLDCLVETKNLELDHADDVRRHLDTDNIRLRNGVKLIREILINLINVLMSWGCKSAGQTLPMQISNEIDKCNLVLVDTAHTDAALRGEE